MRPVDERRQKASPLRDVAGMLRSASYAAHATTERLSAHNRERHADVLRAALEWEALITGVFLAAYRSAAEGLSSVPADPRAFDALLEMHLIEKALYELRYELESRPTWTVIPIRGLLGLLDRAEALVA
jgi:maltose alpha-D-glucosyltransferase/alpha-amylase